MCDGRCGGGKNQINVQVISARCGAPIEMINIVREKGVDWDEESSSKGEDTGKMEKRGWIIITVGLFILPVWAFMGNPKSHVSGAGNLAGRQKKMLPHFMWLLT